MNTLIMKFITENWIVLLLAALIIAFVIWAIVNKKKGILAEIVLDLMCQAERYLQTIPGEERKNEVVMAFYNELPAWMHIFIRKEQIYQLIDIIFRESKELLDKIKQNETAAKIDKLE